MFEALGERLEGLYRASRGAAFPFTCLDIEVEGVRYSIEIESREHRDGLAVAVSVARRADIVDRRWPVRGTHRSLLRRRGDGEDWQPDNSVMF